MTTADSSVWYAETDSGGNDEIGNMTTSGTVTDYAIMPSGKTSMKVVNLATGPDGNVWFTGCASTSPTASSWTLEVGFLDVSTGATTFYPDGTISCNPATGAVPGPITTGSDGNLWFAVNSNGSSSGIDSLDPSTGTIIHAWAASVSQFGGMVTGPDGRLWITGFLGTGSSNVYALTVSGGHKTAASTYTGVNEPESIVVGSDGNLWFYQAGDAYIGKMTTSGVLTQYLPTSLPIGTYSVGTLVAGPDGAIWYTYTHSTNVSIGRMTTTGGISSYTTGGYNNYGTGMTLGSDGAMWFAYTDSSSQYSVGRLGY